MTALMIVSAAIAIAIAILNASIFSLLIVRLWLHAEAPEKLRLRSEDMTFAARRIPRVAAIAAVATAVLVAAGVALVAFLVTRGNEPVLVLAHRGASLSAPENTLAAFRQAIEDEADFVELDVQESLDGVVLVAHDADLMKVAASPTKIWQQTFAELRSIDIGSHKGPQFSSERVPTLAEALAACKGRTKVMIELKTYGHNQRLEQRVVEIVEAAGMEKACAYMSLDHDMARRMKRLRPSWRVGMLIAKALGDPTTLDTDFLAVEARMATPRFVRRAHRAGKDVYVWTVNDPAWMLTALSRGVDGLITDNPALARKVVERRAKLSDAQRLAVALLIRSGARVADLEAENALRP
jgi:glycerophosphoryl diester phosphodiesterase